MAIDMYDTVTPGDLPPDAPAIALYIDGKYAVTDDIWQAHPSALRCEIATNINTQRGNMLDCEPGNCEPSQTPYWVAHRVQAGVAKPIVYCSLSAMNEVVSYLTQAKLPFGILAADWTGEPHDIPGTVGVQYANPPRLPAALAGKNLDLSTITDTSWLLPALGAPAPVQAPAAVPFPLPQGDWYGPPSPDVHNHSGYYWVGDRAGIASVQGKLGITQDGLYGNDTFSHVVGFQRQRGLTVDGLTGEETWRALF